MGTRGLGSAVASQTVEAKLAAEELFPVFTDSSLPAGQSSESEVPTEWNKQTFMAALRANCSHKHNCCWLASAAALPGNHRAYRLEMADQM